MKERKRKHDDVHFPLQGRGKRATKKQKQYYYECSSCGERRGLIHLCTGKEQPKPKEGEG